MEKWSGKLWCMNIMEYCVANKNDKYICNMNTRKICIHDDYNDVCGKQESNSRNRHDCI